MKRLVLVLALAAATAAPALAQVNERGEAKTVVSGKAVAIEYGRPVLKGRDMLAQAEVGTAWRLGADSATTLKTDADLSFGGVLVPKGSYVLTATRLSADKWALGLATNDSEKKKVAEVLLAPAVLAAEVEKFTIDVKAEQDKGEMAFSWGKTTLKTAFTGK